MQSLKGSVVRPGKHARFAVFVWLTAGTSGSANIQLATTPKGFSPIFTVCQPVGGATCKVSGLSARQRIELQARIAVPKKTKNMRVTVTATGTSPQAKKSSSASDEVKVRKATKSKSSPSPTPTPTGPGVGDGGLPPGTLPPGTVPTGSFPGLPNPSGDPGASFPTVQPSSHPSPTTLPRAHSIRATDVSAGLPLNVRLIGGQLVGLAILAAAVTIAVARLSLRGQRPRKPDDPPTDQPSDSPAS